MIGDASYHSRVVRTKRRELTCCGKFCYRISITEGWVNNCSLLSLPPEQLVTRRPSQAETGITAAEHALGRAGGLVWTAARFWPEQGPAIWPPGVLGSITHTDWYCGAAVARTADFTALGIDAEHTLAGRCHRPSYMYETEKDWCGRAANPGIIGQTSLLRTKKLFKAAYPLLGVDPGHLTSILLSISTPGRSACGRQEHGEVGSYA